MSADRPPAAVAFTGTRASTVFGACLAGVVLAAGTLIDRGAQASFNAPKRLFVLLMVVGALLAWLWARPGPGGDRWTPVARRLVALAAFLAGWLVLATIFAPQPALALDPLRYMLLCAALVALGASPVWTPLWRRRLLWLALGVCGLNAAISLLQGLGVNPVPLTLARLGGRYPTIALLGNEGYVALAAALAGCAALALLTQRDLDRRWRALAGALLLLVLATIASNRQLTSLVALGAAALVLLCVRLRWRHAVVAGSVMVLLGAVCALQPALQRATWAQAGSLEQWQFRTVWRISGWAAALEMGAQRPLLGQGPGSYARESQRFRLAAELRWQQRLPPPQNANAFGEAHNEFLQLGAEGGWPALLAAVAGLCLLLQQLLCRAMVDPVLEPRLLLAVLAGGSVAALAWFPLQIPLTAVLLLLAAGRAWRLLASKAVPR